MNEANLSLAQFNGKRRGWISKNGSWYDPKTGEFVAKTENGNLKLYDNNQVVGEKDPPQPKPINAKAQQIIAAKKRPSRNVSIQTVENYDQILRDKYISGQIFNIGEWVENVNTGLVGKIIRRGTNHLICVTENDDMFKSWIKDIVEWTDQSGVPANQREVGTDELRNYVMKMTGTKKIDNFNIKKFINKYKAIKRSN